MQAIRAAVAYDGERFLDGGATVFVADGTIAGVESVGCDLPEDCSVVEHAGTLLPGLFDCHVHLVADATIGGLERAATYDEGELDAVITQSLRQQEAGGCDHGSPVTATSWVPRWRDRRPSATRSTSMRSAASTSSR
jgi:cytosine/adenosine deaminase-related metal-dependent hydrolase